MKSVLCAGLLLACGAARVEPETHGVTVPAGPCGRGLVVVESDYQSSNVALLGFDGATLSSSIASSSTESSGFGVALSGDVVPASAPQENGEIVLLDRYPAGVLRFIDPTVPRVRAELPVGTGFRANPQDYLALGERRAYVARYQRNPNPGREPFDEGADVLVVDPSVPRIEGRIALDAALEGEAARYSAHPARLLETAGRVFTVLAAYSDDFTSATSSRLVELDPSTDTLASVLVLDGLRGCTGLAVSPDGRRLAVSCTGDDLVHAAPSLDGSGLALIDIAGSPTLERRVAASELGSQVVGFSVDFVTDRSLVLGLLGQFDSNGSPVRDDSLVVWDAETGETREIARSKSEPYTLGGARCESACGACFATDASRSNGAVLRFPIEASGELAPPTSIASAAGIGLPPRYLGAF